MQNKRNKKKEQKLTDHDIEMKIIFICVVAIWGFDAVCVCQQQSINQNCKQDTKGLSVKCQMNYWGRQIKAERRCHLWPHYGNSTIYCPECGCCMFSNDIWAKMIEVSSAENSDWFSFTWMLENINARHYIWPYNEHHVINVSPGAVCKHSPKLFMGKMDI